jgi:hypothetical protein
MTVLFGTVEYFEREFLTYAAKNHLSQLANDQILMIYSRLKNELLYDFVCAERIRMECFENLEQACSKLKNSEMRALAK